MYPRRGAGQREPPALHARKPLADRVHLHNVRTAGKELLRNVLQLLRRQQRLFQQRRTAAGQQKQHVVPCAEVLHRVQRQRRGAEAVLIRHGMPRLTDHERVELPLGVSVFRDHHAAIDASMQDVQRCTRHLPRGFSHRDDDPPAVPAQLEPSQRFGNSRAGHNVAQRGADDLHCIVSHALHRSFVLSLLL